MRNPERGVRSFSLLALAVAILVPAGGSVRADDTTFFSNQVAPNVVLIFDNSGSMNNMVWHSAFSTDLFYDGVCSTDPTDVAYDENCLTYPLCPIVNGDSEFNGWFSWGNGGVETLSGVGTVTKSDNDSDCGDREVFQDPAVEAASNDTLWDLLYLRWYFSRNVDLDPDGDGRTILTEILDGDDGQRSSCALAQNGSLSATYPLYKRARVTAAQDIVRDVICNTSQIASIRYGLAHFDDTNSDPEGGYLVVPVADYDATQAAALDAAIGDITGESYTPLAETLYNVYRYFQSRTSTETALGKNGSTRFPVYDLNTSGGTSGTIPPSPITSECQQNFVVLITDGEPTRDDFDSMDLTRFETELIGDYNDPGDETEVPGDSNESSRYLDDIAKFMNEKDFLPDAAYPDTQTIDVYTVGFTTGTVANDLLYRTALAGNGQFFFSNNAEELTTALSSAISDIVAKSNAFTAAAVPASRATDGNNFFTTYFTPAESDPQWSGHLKLFDFSADGEILDAPIVDGGTGGCALNDPQAPTRCRIGGLNLALDGFWDAGEEVPDAGSRSLYVSNYPSAPPSTIPVLPPAFTDTGGGQLTPTDLGIAGATSSDIAAYDNGVVGFDMTGIATDTELADAIVGYIRGCEFDNSGTCTDRGAFRKLWDIFHSNPLVVGPPNAGLRSRNYRDFVIHYKNRKRVIYAGSNGGFLHGFNAGEWDTGLTPPRYDRGTGVEEFGFMAYPARQEIAKLPKDTWPRGVDGWSGYTMDGSPSAADVWFYNDAIDHPDDGDMSWQDWRTVLIGGMREGGRAVWALDVTDPDAITGAPTMYPGYLWEFPCESSGCDAWRPYMGDTWSQPVITRVKATIDCDGSSCPTYDRWVAIFGAGYDQAGDPNQPAHETVAGSVDPGEYDASDEAGTSRAGRALFMIDIATGEVLGSKRYDDTGTAHDSSDGEPEMLYALASAPSVFDTNFDGYGDVVYIGDLGGNLWKWVIHDPAQDHINGTEGTDQQARWPFVKILETENCTGCSPEHFKSFFNPPTGSMVGPNLWLALGSGERLDLDYGRDGGLTTPEKNRFYVFKDKDPLALEYDSFSPDAPYTDVSSSIDFIDGSAMVDFNPNTCLSGGHVGFYLEGEDGEKFITDSIIFFGVVFTASYIPSPSTASVCSANGTSFLYGFDLLCGEGRFPPDSGDPTDPNERRIEIGEGLPNSPRVSVGPTSEGSGDPDDGDPCKDMVIVITSENGGFSDGRCERSNSGLGMQSWRDR